jgi:hypothetical protein
LECWSASAFATLHSSDGEKLARRSPAFPSDPLPLPLLLAPVSSPLLRLPLWVGVLFFTGIGSLPVATGVPNPPALSVSSCHLLSPLRSHHTCLRSLCFVDIRRRTTLDEPDFPSCFDGQGCARFSPLLLSRTYTIPLPADKVHWSLALRVHRPATPNAIAKRRIGLKLLVRCGCFRIVRF